MNYKTIDVLPCASKDKRAIRAAAAFPARLKEKHNDTIRIREGAVYKGGGAKPKPGETSEDYKIPVVCMKCGGAFEQTPHYFISGKGRGCKVCAKEKLNAGRTGLKVIGKMKRRAAEPGEIEKARKLYAETNNYCEVGRQLGRTTSTILQWLDPEYKERQNRRARKKVARDKASGYQKLREDAYVKSSRGRAIRTKGWQKRRANKSLSLDYVYLCDVDLDELQPPYVEPEEIESKWFVDYNIWDDFDYGDGDIKPGVGHDSEAQKMLSFTGADEDAAKRKKQCQKLEKISGEKYSLEHLIPISRGGLHCPENFANRALELNLQKNNSRWEADDALFCKRLFGIT